MKRFLLLIVGAQRSGTTALGLLLAKHRDLFITVHGKLLYYLILWIYHDFNTETTSHLRLDEVAYSLTRKQVLGVEPSVVLEIERMLLTDCKPSRFYGLTKEQIISLIWTEVYTKLSSNKTILGDKYNEYLLQLNEIQQIFPDMHYIFIHRNHKDVAESMVRSFEGRPWVPETYEDAVIKWAQWNKKWLQFRTRIKREYYYEIDYDNMVNKPAKVILETCEFLDIPFYQEYLDLTKSSLSKDQINKGSSSIDINYKKVLKIVPDFWSICSSLGHETLGN